ncbi:TetR/AcrR family transcriptional regulator [Alloalcanivorax mobilis]|uniref:TetR/AcrR family transcriptional regulator n=1 Tax=Alloalcanivorax mobilis TaxID=2019569 RepID=UPI000B5B48D0|nr:TetR/AcrR family transcriptional regulator [Alloalcanivorax mobilis]ASK36309.1 TetR family transcriptional regulator [Alcanivorax sp. N3-2A]|tara:strand:+ start:9427 stop:10137 length:711 start_codon:yes stop_codon:yes gene_type:complete
MITDYEAFKIDLRLSKEDICKELFRQNRDHIRIKKEAVAVRNLAKLIDSTLRLANSKGFHAMSLRDLCADSGLSMGGLYAYIKNKGDLLNLIQSHGFMLTRRTLLSYTERVQDPREKLLTAIQAHLYLSELMRAWFYFSYMETKSLPEKERLDAIAIEREVEGIFRDIIDQGVAAGVFRDVNARLTASLTKAMLQDWYLKRGKYREQKVCVNQYAEVVRDVLEGYLLSEKIENGES